jgi:LPS export ABC transporter protein LptC
MEMIKRGRKKMFIVVVLAAVLSAVAVVIVIIPRDAEKETLKIKSDHIDLQVRNVRFTEVGDSNMTLEITADMAGYQKKEKQAFFEKPTVKLILKDGRTFTMTGERGRFNTDTKDIEIEGHVGIVSENGDRFATDRLRYSNASKLIETESAVVMENKHIRVSGVGMTLSLDEKRVALLSQVRASYKEERSEGR